MPLYSDLGLYGTPSTSYSGLYLSGPYSNHSSLLNSSYHSPIYVKALPRSFSRGYAPHLATISETQSISPLRRHFSPKIILHSSPKFKVPKPIKINTADIDVSVNKYRKYDRKTPEPKVNPEKSKSPSPSAVTENQDIEKTEPNQIRRDRALVRLHTVHKKDSPRRNVPNNGAEGPKSWRHNFYEDELKVEERRPKRTPGELLVDKFLIRTKEEEERLIQEGRKIVRKPTVKRPPSNRFHEICRVISSDTINEDLNPGQPLEIARRQSKQFDEDAFNKVRRSSAEIMESDQNILDDMLRKDHLLNQEDENNNIQTKRKKKVTKKKSNEKLVPDMEVKIHRRPTLKKIRRTSTDSSLLSDIVVDEDIERAYQEAIRDISQVEVEEIKVKPKPSFTATVDIDTKPNLKAVVDEVEIVESPTAKKPVKKFKYNVTVEIDEQSTPKMLVDENNLPQSTLNVSNSAIAIKRERSKSPLQEIKEEKMESISGKLQHAGAKEALSTVLPKKVNTTQKGENLEEIPKKVLAITQKSKLIPKDETPPQSPKIKNAFGKFGTDAAMKTKTVTQLADNKVSKSIDNAAVPANKLTVVEKCESAETKQALVNNQKTHNEPLDRIGAKSNEVKKSKSDTNQEPSKTVNTTSVKTNELKKSSSVPKLGLLQSNEPTSPKDKAPKLGLSQEQVILKTDKGIQKANVDKSDTKIDVVIKKQDTEASKLLANEKLKLNELGPMSPKFNVSQLPKTQQKPEEHKPKTEEPRKQLGTKIAPKEEVKTNDVASPKCQEKLITVEPQSPKNIGNTSHVTEKPNAITKLVETKSQPKQPQSPKKVTSKIEPKLAPKEDNKSGENFWDKICTRESVYLDSRRKKLQERRKASFITEEDEENERNSIHNRKTDLLKSEEVKVQVVPDIDQKPSKLAGVAKVDKNEIIKIDDIKKPVEINRNEPVLQKKLESVNITKLTEDKSSKPTIKNSKEAALIPTLIAKENEVSKPSGLEAISKTEVPQISTLNKTPKTTTQVSSAELIELSKPLPTAIKTTLKPNDVVKQGAATVITTKSNEISPTSKQPSKVDNVDKPVDIPKPTAKLPEISTITSKLKESSSSLPKPKESTEVKIIDKSIEKLQTKNEPLISEIVDKITADEVNKKNKGLKLDIRKENYNAENTCQDKEKANGNQIVVQQLKESASEVSPNKDKAKAVESKPKLKASKSEEKPIEANYNSEEKSSPKDKPIGNAKVVDESKQSSPEASTNKNKKLVKSKPKLKTEKSEEKPIEDNQESTNPEDNPPAPEGKLAKKIVSKRSLINKSGVQDPDLEVFIVPKTPTPPPVSNEPPKFIPLQSNRLSQWMHPYKKPDQLEECPIQIYARPKTIRHRYYPHKRDKSVKADPPKPPEPEPEEEEEEAVAEEEENDEEEQTSGESGSGSGEEDEDDDDDDDDSEDSIDYEELNDVWGYRKVGASTSSDDSGFDSSSLGNRINKDCDVNCHKKCEKLTANLCGVNQKLIVEAIESVKKGCSERDSPTSNPAHNPAFALDPAELAEEFSQSSTFAGFQKSGRITPPATTIPRFRKYNLEDFHFLKVLGKGSFGKVLLAELKETEYYYAIKCLKKDVVMEDDDVECTLIERKVLALGTKHPYLCHLLCTFQTESHLFFVMEYLNGGDLMFHIQQSGRFLEPRARFYAAEIVSGLKFLHSKGIVYRDLKLDNILLDFDGHVRIADFGMCKLQIFLDRTADTFCGTPDYMAPEIIKGQHYNQNVDWWSFGVLLYEMLIGQSPFSGCDEDELFWSICNELPVLPRFLSKEANEILKLLLEKDATKRLGNKFCVHGDIQDQPFFHPIAWDLLSLRQLEPPFKPNLQHPLDTQYFDRTFTVEKAKLTPIEKDILQSMDQAQFQGFSYTNPNATDR